MIHEAYPLALEAAALEALEGRYEADELGQRVERAGLEEKAFNLIQLPPQADWYTGATDCNTLNRMSLIVPHCVHCVTVVNLHKIAPESPLFRPGALFGNRHRARRRHPDMLLLAVSLAGVSRTVTNPCPMLHGFLLSGPGISDHSPAS